VSLSGSTGRRDNELNWERAGALRYTLPLIDLHARRHAERTRTLRESRRYLALVVALLVCILVMFLPLKIQLTALYSRVAQAQADAAQWQQRTQQLSQADGALDARLSNWTRYQESRDRRLAYINLCTMLAARLPASVYLEQIQIDAKAEPEQIVLSGCAESMVALQDYARSLAGVTFFTNVHLAETTPFALLGLDAVRFRIEVRGNRTLNPPKE
jgi:Tfp pilus assembly protein PilN